VKLESEMQRLAAYEALMRASPDQQISLTDPDSRSMATSGRGSGLVGYNVQITVDTEHHLIITHEVTNVGSDRSQLANVAKQAKAVLKMEKLEAVADRGYFNGTEILACEQAGIAVTLPKPMTSGAKSEGRFGKQDFVYLPEEDVYRCPAAQRFEVLLHRRGARAKAASLHDQRLSLLCHQGPMHHGQGAPDYPMGARACARSCTAPPRPKSAGDARSPRGGRAPFRHNESAHGRDALSDENASPPKWRSVCSHTNSRA
jgi:hypothetical protein